MQNNNNFCLYCRSNFCLPPLFALKILVCPPPQACPKKLKPPPPMRRGLFTISMQPPLFSFFSFLVFVDFNYLVPVQSGSKLVSTKFHYYTDHIKHSKYKNGLKLTKYRCFNCTFYFIFFKIQKTLFKSSWTYIRPLRTESTQPKQKM